MTTPISNDQLRINIEMGDDFQPPVRLAAALTELHAALQDDGSEVEGFLGNFEIQDFTARTISFDSSLKLGPSGGDGYMKTDLGDGLKHRSAGWKVGD